MIVTPDSFASQLLTVNHLLLQRNLIASARGSFASIFIGHLQLPQLTQMLLNDRSRVNHSMFEVHTQPASQTGKLLSFKDQLLNVIGTGWSTITAVFGLGKGAQDYAHFERCILKALKSSKRTVYTVGQYSTLALCVRSIHPRHMERALAYLPTMPGATGPLSITAHGLSEPHHSLIPVRSTTNSSSESDHDGGEDLASSRHTVTSDEDGSGGSVTGLDASWVGVESGN